MPELKLPPFEVRLRSELQRTEIFDVFRKRFVSLSAEEWVRQHMLHYLVNHLNYPAGRLGVEISLRLHGLTRRADIVVYDSDRKPWMLVECKAAHKELKQEVFDQAARYNLSMQVPYLVVTNGIKLMAAEISHETRTVNQLNQMPQYPYNP